MDTAAPQWNERLETYRKTFCHSDDFHVNQFQMGNKECALLWFSSMIDHEALADKIQHIMDNFYQQEEELQHDVTLEKLCRRAMPGTGYIVEREQSLLIDECLRGKAVLLLDGVKGGICIEASNSKGYRQVEEPSTQTIIKGPKEGFTESIQTNIGLVRRRIIHPGLCFEKFVLGTDTRTIVYLAYIDGIINQGVLEEARKRLGQVKPNALFDSGMLEDYIVDKTFTPFPIIYTTERPDGICGHLVSGKAAIMVDGSPFVLSIPTVFSDFFQSSEDYYQPFMISTFVRCIRYLAFLIALLFPAIYISAITYHMELIPTELLFTISSQRENLPFPVFVEAMLMEITFEILREAGVRMPRAVGPTVSIVGGLVIGTAAVEAGIVSNIMVIIVALTAISSFVSPIYNLSVSSRLLRFGLLTLGALAGFYGVMMGMMAMIGHMCSLRSFGVPYTAPFAPLYIQEHEDILLRFPLWFMKKRPAYLHSPKPVKQEGTYNPSPPRKGKGRRP
ncbi:MAG: spore germination protein [Paenibacillaceae bacterium]|jgi:spore germination protein KA|nr:spore germination protein [Paenibacillaceae bacterium]